MDKQSTLALLTSIDADQGKDLFATISSIATNWRLPAPVPAPVSFMDQVMTKVFIEFKSLILVISGATLEEIRQFKFKVDTNLVFWTNLEDWNEGFVHVAALAINSDAKIIVVDSTDVSEFKNDEQIRKILTSIGLSQRLVIFTKSVPRIRDMSNLEFYQVVNSQLELKTDLVINPTFSSNGLEELYRRIFNRVFEEGPSIAIVIIDKEQYGEISFALMTHDSDRCNVVSHNDKDAIIGNLYMNKHPVSTVNLTGVADIELTYNSFSFLHTLGGVKRHLFIFIDRIPMKSDAENIRYYKVTTEGLRNY